MLILQTYRSRINHPINQSIHILLMFDERFNDTHDDNDDDGCCLILPLLIRVYVEAKSLLSCRGMLLIGQSMTLLQSTSSSSSSSLYPNYITSVVFFAMTGVPTKHLNELPDGLNAESLSTVHSVSSNALTWLLSRRSDALICMDEIIRIRGRYVCYASLIRYDTRR